MSISDEFDLENFLPYLLNQAAEEASLSFQQVYKARYGMLRAEWRVLFHLGRYGRLTAKEICQRSKMHKTKISRAVAKLEARRFLARERGGDDRRLEYLELTGPGQRAYRDLQAVAHRYDADLTAAFKPDEVALLRDMLRRLAVGGQGHK
ncbi:MarR family winged helix-turn-helix transcriptional regulator [Aquicoccus sp. G2-2]|uniref:MarR family winged helix-turn-helix transcriptional regulator n=1 Tax=Aquicoccus sp. G2-2 TaxID=3092120 RepID=UPI002AE01A42|nr:MarR family transcriptional regulator [Aquicoccus sp. G2-2]MEA1113521.1 MarR family transcriptional regulator [Aquicoccus sp. G2-2]